jgi:hypothetical protein
MLFTVFAPVTAGRVDRQSPRESLFRSIKIFRLRLPPAKPISQPFLQVPAFSNGFGCPSLFGEPLDFPKVKPKLHKSPIHPDTESRINSAFSTKRDQGGPPDVLGGLTPHY